MILESNDKNKIDSESIQYTRNELFYVWNSLALMVLFPFTVLQALHNTGWNIRHFQIGARKPSTWWRRIKMNIRVQKRIFPMETIKCSYVSYDYAFYEEYGICVGLRVYIYGLRGKPCLSSYE